MENCVYRFINKDGEIIYIGKAKFINQRLNNHNHLSEDCYKEIDIIEYCTFETEYEMDLAERYYIPKIKPKYNTMLNNNTLNISISEFDNKEWLVYRKPKKPKKSIKDKIVLSDNIIRFEKYLQEIQEEKEKAYNRNLNRKIILPYTEEVFENMFIASEVFDLDVNEIYNLTEGKIYYGYKHPKYKCPMVFMYYEIFLEHREKDINYLKYDNQRYTREIICLTTNEVFINSIKIEEKYNITSSNIMRCCNGLSNYVGVVDNKPMVYKWLDDYKNMAKNEISELMNRAIKIKEKRKIK